MICELPTDKHEEAAILVGVAECGNGMENLERSFLCGASVEPPTPPDKENVLGSLMQTLDE